MEQETNNEQNVEQVESNIFDQDWFQFFKSYAEKNKLKQVNLWKIPVRVWKQDLLKVSSK